MVWHIAQIMRYHHSPPDIIGALCPTFGAQYPPKNNAMKLIVLLLSLISTSVYGGTLHLDKAATGKVRQAADIRYANHDEKQTYQLKIGKQWIPGSCSTSGTGNLHALLVDMNFDGHADLWVTGYTDSQGRIRCSDVWLWDAPAKQYRFNQPMSAIPLYQLQSCLLE